MTPRFPRPRLVALATLLLVVSAQTACGGGDSGSEQVTDIAPLEVPAVPSELVGLRVQSEDVHASLADVERTYVESVALFSLRSADDLVQATLQINRFKPEDRYATDRFRRTVVSQIGSAQPLQTVMDDRTVWRTTGTKQRVAVWFEGRHMFLLAVREDFGRPRTLIRTALELRP